MVLLPQGLLPHWPADYRSDAVELYRKYEAGVITKAEIETQLLERYPKFDIPHERTLRRWAREKYRDLPEQRRQFLRPQELDREPNHVPVAGGLQGVQRAPIFCVAPQQVTPVRSSFLETSQLWNCMVACVVVAMCAALSRTVITSS